MNRYKKQKAKMISNTLTFIEETNLRIKLAKESKDEEDYLFSLQMLICFKPNASLRQINNQRKLNFG